jgi:hypothetical protein
MYTLVSGYHYSGSYESHHSFHQPRALLAQLSSAQLHLVPAPAPASVFPSPSSCNSALPPSSSPSPSSSSVIFRLSSIFLISSADASEMLPPRYVLIGGSNVSDVFQAVELGDCIGSMKGCSGAEEAVPTSV